MRLSHLALACWAFSIAGLAAAEPETQLLPTGQALTPTAAPGSRFTPLVTQIGPYPSFVADGAAAIAVSPDKHEMLVQTSGFNQYNEANGKVSAQQSTQFVFRYAIDGSGARRLQTLQVPNSFGGIAWRHVFANSALGSSPSRRCRRRPSPPVPGCPTTNRECRSLPCGVRPLTHP